MADLGVHVPRYTIDLILQPLRLDPMSEESHPLTRNTNSGHKVKDLLAMRCEYQAYQADRIRRRKGQVVGQWLKLKTWQLHLASWKILKQADECMSFGRQSAATATPLTSLATQCRPAGAVPVSWRAIDNFVPRLGQQRWIWRHFRPIFQDFNYRVKERLVHLWQL